MDGKVEGYQKNNDGIAKKWSWTLSMVHQKDSFNFMKKRTTRSLLPFPYLIFSTCSPIYFAKISSLHSYNCITNWHTFSPPLFLSFFSTLSLSLSLSPSLSISASLSPSILLLSTFFFSNSSPWDLLSSRSCRPVHCYCLGVCVTLLSLLSQRWQGVESSLHNIMSRPTLWI